MPDYEFFASLARSEMPRPNAPGDLDFTIIPNTNASARRSPDLTNGSSNRIIVDFDNTRASLTDRELYKLVIRKNNVSVNEQVLIELVDIPKERVRFFDQNGQPLLWANQPSRNLIPLQFTGQFSVIFCDIDFFSSSPLIAAAPAQFLLRVVRVNAPANEFVVSLTVNIATFRVIGDSEHAELLLMADLGDKNKASTLDVAEAMQSISRRFQLIPENISNNDAWIQDQFQLAELILPSNTRANTTSKKVIINLPRFVNKEFSGNNLSGLSNLSNFVESFFPSANIFYAGDFQKLKFKFTTVQPNQPNTQIELPIAQAYRVFLNVNAVISLKDILVEFAKELLSTTSNPTSSTSPPGTANPQTNGGGQDIASRDLAFRGTVSAAELNNDLESVIKQTIPGLINIIGTKIREQGSHPNFQVNQDRLNAMSRRSDQIRSFFNDAARTYTIQINSVSNSASTVFSIDSLQRFLEEWAPLFDSTSFGGNIEVTPPTHTLPHGKLIVGSHNNRPIHSDLKSFLQNNHGNITEMDTSWLEVGHVDEVICFTKNSRDTSNFYSLYASHQLANNIMMQAIRLHNSGRPATNQIPLTFHSIPNNDFLRHRFDDTTIGTRPISYLLRGKKWKHAAYNPLLASDHPPETYKALHVLHDGPYFTTRQVQSRDMGGSAIGDYSGISNSSTTSYLHGERRFFRFVTNDTYYPAHISASELLFIEHKAISNQPFDIRNLLSEQIHTNITNSLNTIYESTTRDTNNYSVPLPVIFSLLKDNKTSAFTPNLVNLQQIDENMIVQRPYGPRMGFDDCRLVIRNLLQGNDTPINASLKSRMLSLLNTPNYFITKKLNLTVYWHNGNNDGEEAAWIRSIDDIGRLFISNYDTLPPTSQSAFKNSVVNFRLNRGKFNGSGDLVNHRLVQKIIIPENTVDLFELYTQLALESMGKRVHWVDGWYYHVRLGGIHCGTNVLRGATTQTSHRSR